MNWPQTAFTLLAALWAGIVMGVSFIAAPVKFLAPSLTLPVALDVGRATFGISVRVELGMAVTLVALAVWAYGWEAKSVAATAVLAALLVQVIVLLPLLDARTQAVIAGQTLAPSWHHVAWIVADASRLLLLLGLAIFGAQGLAHR